MSRFEPATRKATKARIALSGPPGSGKTWTGLTLAHVLAAGKPIAGIDTERRSMSKYVGVNGWHFNTSTPETFEPLDLVNLLADAAATEHEVVLVDSFSHYWSGTGGMLDQVDRRTKGGNTFGTGWKEMRPEERAMIDALLAYPGHVIVTFRVKTEYVVQDNDRGKKEPVKVGLKPEQREGIEYEFDLVGDLDQDNTLTVTKSRLLTVPNRSIIQKPDLEFAGQILNWTLEGDPSITVNDLVLQLNDPALTTADVISIGVEMNKAGLRHAAVHGPEGRAMPMYHLVNLRYEQLANPTAPPEQPTDIGDGGAPV